MDILKMCFISYIQEWKNEKIHLNSRKTPAKDNDTEKFFSQIPLKVAKKLYKFYQEVCVFNASIAFYKFKSCCCCCCSSSSSSSCCDTLQEVVKSHK